MFSLKTTFYLPEASPWTKASLRQTSLSSDPVLVGPSLATDPARCPCQTQYFPEPSSVSKSDPVWPRTQVCRPARPSSPWAGSREQSDQQGRRACELTAEKPGSWGLRATRPQPAEAAAPGAPQVPVSGCSQLREPLEAPFSPLF